MVKDWLDIALDVNALLGAVEAGREKRLPSGVYRTLKAFLRAAQDEGLRQLEGPKAVVRKRSRPATRRRWSGRQTPW